jgi:hypothetical protein
MASSNILQTRHKQQHGRCIWCGRTCYIHPRGGFAEIYDAMGFTERTKEQKAEVKRSIATREHIIPRKKRGGSANINIVMACTDCNSRRGHSTEVFKPLPSVMAFLPREVRNHILAHVGNGESIAPRYQSIFEVSD